MNLEQSVATGANQGTYCDADHIEITGTHLDQQKNCEIAQIQIQFGFIS